MQIDHVYVGPVDTNCYVISCAETGEAAVIDPGGSCAEILALAKQKGLEITQIINTHGHGDHIAANGELKAATGAVILIHTADADFLTDSRRSLLSFMGVKLQLPPADRLLNDGDTIQVGKFTLEVLHTPGHTPGGICLKGDSVIFTGDSLFAGSIGRTDFPGGSYQNLIDSIQTKLMVYDDDMVIYPGHGPESTLGVERMSNPYLR